MKEKNEEEKMQKRKGRRNIKQEERKKQKIHSGLICDGFSLEVSAAVPI
jgi:SOS response regulatory protein OraA/RecX